MKLDKKNVIKMLSEEPLVVNLLRNNKLQGYEFHLLEPDMNQVVLKDPFYIQFTKILVPNEKGRMVTVNNPDSSYLRYLLGDSEVRNNVLSFVSSLVLIKDVFDKALHITNSQVTTGSVITSYSAIREAIHKVLPSIAIDSPSHIFLSHIVHQYLQSYGLVFHESEIDTYMKISNGDSVSNYMNDVVINSYLDNAIKAIPEKGNIKANRTTTYEMATEFNILFTSFRHRLVDFDYFETAFRSVLTRIHAYITVKDQKMFGDDYGSIVSSPQMAMLMSYVNILYSAINLDSKDMIVSASRLWERQDERVLQGIENIVAEGFVKELTKVDYMRSFDIKVIKSIADDEYASKRYVIIGRNDVCKIPTKAFRVYNYDDTSLKSFVEDPRMIDTTALEACVRNLKFDDILASHLSATVRPLSSRAVITRDCSKDEVELLAMCLADTVAINRDGTADVFYQFSVKTEDLVSGFVNYAVGDIARTLDPYFIIFNRLDNDASSSRERSEMFSGFDIKANRIYAIDYETGDLKSVFTLIDKKSVVNLNADFSDRQIVIKYALLDNLYSGNLSQVVIMRDPNLANHLKNFIANTKELYDFFSSVGGSDSELDLAKSNSLSLLYLQLLDVMVSLSRSCIAFDAHSYNALWRQARRLNVLRSDMLNDIMFKLTVRHFSMVLATSLLGVDVSDLWSMMSSRRFELAKSLSMIS